MRTSKLFHKVPAFLMAALAASCVWAVGENDAGRSTLDSINPYRFARPLAGWPSGWGPLDKSALPSEPRLKLGSVYVKPSLFSNADGGSGAGFWLGRGETWRLAVGTRRQSARSGLGFAPDMGESSLVTASYLWSDQQSLSLQWLRQGNAEQGQRTLNLVYGTELSGSEKIKVGISAITGWAPLGGSQQRIGLSLGYDWPSYFVQLAYDPKANFGTQDQFRVSAGTRF
ncbi:MAG: hypothetical protein V4562_02800 [Pseudomonadota bacterium]